MNARASATVRPIPAPAGVPQTLREHLDKEEAAVRELTLALRDVRVALLKNDLDAFTAALARQATAAQQGENVRAQRIEVLGRVANDYGIGAAEVTLRSLASQLPNDVSVWLMKRRDQLVALAMEMERLNRQNAALVQHSVDLTRQVLAELTKQTPGGHGYDAYGGRRDSVGGSIFELGG